MKRYNGLVALLLAVSFIVFTIYFYYRSCESGYLQREQMTRGQWGGEAIVVPVGQGF